MPGSMKLTEDLLEFQQGWQPDLVLDESKHRDLSGLITRIKSEAAELTPDLSRAIENLENRITPLSGEEAISMQDVQQVTSAYLRNTLQNNWNASGNKNEAIERIIKCLQENEASLDLSGLELSSLPPNLNSYLSKLTSFSFSNNKLYGNLDLKGFPVQLESLDLSCNKIGELHNFSDLIHLRNLNLFNNKLFGTVDLNNYPGGLTSLDFSSNEIRELSNIPWLGRLEKVDLSGNKILVYPDFKLEPLLLNLQNNPGTKNVNEAFKEFRGKSSDEIMRLLSLDTWETGGNRDEAIQRIVRCFKYNLNSLDLKGLGLTSLPSELFTHLDQVTYLNLANNQFQGDLDVEKYPIGLNSLDCSGNQITAILNSSKLTDLNYLNLANNQLKGNLDLRDYSIHLDNFILSGNKIETLSNTFHCSLLYSLNLSKNALILCPNFETEPKVLFLQDNPITKNPDMAFTELRKSSLVAIASFLELDSWKTEGNKEEAIKRIVRCFKHNVNVLDLQNLGLTSLPPKLFDYLPQLEKLNLSNNNLSEYPERPNLQVDFENNLGRLDSDLA